MSKLACILGGAAIPPVTAWLSGMEFVRSPLLGILFYVTLLGAALGQAFWSDFFKDRR